MPPHTVLLADWGKRFLEGSLGNSSRKFRERWAWGAGGLMRTRDPFRGLLGHSWLQYWGSDPVGVQSKCLNLVPSSLPPCLCTGLFAFSAPVVAFPFSHLIPRGADCHRAIIELRFSQRSEHGSVCILIPSLGRGALLSPSAFSWASFVSVCRRLRIRLLDRAGRTSSVH